MFFLFTYLYYYILLFFVAGGIQTYNITKDKSWDSMPGLSDLSYDGEKWNGFFTHGLGKLVDGTLGGDDVKVDSTVSGKGE